MGPIVRPDICPLPTGWAAAGLEYVDPSPKNRSHFEAVLGHCQGFLHIAKIVALFWMGSGQVHIGG